MSRKLNITDPQGERWIYSPANVTSQSPYEMWNLLPLVYGDRNKYRIVRRRDRYYPERELKPLGEFPDLDSAKRCLVAAALRSRPQRIGWRRNFTTAPARPRPTST